MTNVNFLFRTQIKIVHPAHHNLCRAAFDYTYKSHSHPSLYSSAERCCWPGAHTTRLYPRSLLSWVELWPNIDQWWSIEAYHYYYARRQQYQRQQQQQQHSAEEQNLPAGGAGSQVETNCLYINLLRLPLLNDGAFNMMITFWLPRLRRPSEHIKCDRELYACRAKRDHDEEEEEDDYDAMDD